MIDPVTLEVLRNRFDSIAEEIQLTLLRSSYSVILKEGEDCSAAVFSAAGEIIAQSTALPQHMGAFIPALLPIDFRQGILILAAFYALLAIGSWYRAWLRARERRSGEETPGY